MTPEISLAFVTMTFMNSLHQETLTGLQKVSFKGKAMKGAEQDTPLSMPVKSR